MSALEIRAGDQTLTMLFLTEALQKLLKFSNLSVCLIELVLNISNLSVCLSQLFFRILEFVVGGLELLVKSSHFVFQRRNLLLVSFDGPVASLKLQLNIRDGPVASLNLGVFRRNRRLASFDSFVASLNLGVFRLLEVSRLLLLFCKSFFKLTNLVLILLQLQLLALDVVLQLVDPPLDITRFLHASLKLALRLGQPLFRFGSLLFRREKGIL